MQEPHTETLKKNKHHTEIANAIQNERNDTWRDQRRRRFTVLGEIGQRMSGTLGRGSVGFVPRESRVEDADLFGNVGEERGAVVGCGRRRPRRDLVVVVEFALLPLGEALIVAPLKLHERVKRKKVLNRVWLLSDRNWKERVGRDGN